MPTYTQANLNTAVSYMVSGSYSAAVFLQVANDAVKEVLIDSDLRSTKRKSALSPNMFDDVFQYSCPSDLKGNKLIDVKPQMNRVRKDYWRLTTAEEFDRHKSDLQDEEHLVAISDADLVRKLLLSKPITDTSLVVDSLSAVDDWSGYGDGENLTADVSNFVKGSASVNWDIDSAGGTTAGIVNTSLTSFDISEYSSLGYAFVWVYITSATDLTNFILRMGSSSSNYYSITITTNNEGASFYAGWNLLRWDFTNKTTTGTVVEVSCTYAAIYMTKETGKVSETDYRFNNLVLRIGDHYDVIYYSKYLWQTSSGTYLEDATTTSDKINVDTEEYSIICEKVAEYIEQYLKNESEADRHRNRYISKIAKYSIDSPSEILTLTTQYRSL